MLARQAGQRPDCAYLHRVAAATHQQSDERLDAVELGRGRLIRGVVCRQRPEGPCGSVLDLVRALLDKGDQRGHRPRPGHRVLNLAVTLGESVERIGGIRLHVAIGAAQHRDKRRDHARLRHRALDLLVALRELSDGTCGERA